MKTINIYITREQKKKADKVRMKYKVSLSTLVGIVSFELVNMLTKTYKIELLEQLQNNYLQKNGNYKTSVKPKEINESLSGLKNKNILATNSLIIYLDKTISNYLDKDHLNKYYANIDKKLNQAYDTYWDFNNGIRNLRRMIKQNKSYWKKVIENE